MEEIKVSKKKILSGKIKIIENDIRWKQGKIIRYDVVWYDMIWYDMIWYGMIWYDMVWYDMIWY